MSVSEYEAAAGAWAQAQADVMSLAGMVREVGNTLLCDPDRFTFRDQPIDLPLVQVIPGAHSPSAKEWPSVEDIMLKLQRYHQAKAQFIKERARLTREQQATVEPPQLLS